MSHNSYIKVRFDILLLLSETSTYICHVHDVRTTIRKRTVMFIDRSPGGFTGALSALSAVCKNGLHFTGETLAGRRNHLTFAFHPPRRLCPCSRHALRSRECSFHGLSRRQNNIILHLVRTMRMKERFRLSCVTLAFSCLAKPSATRLDLSNLDN